MEFSKRKTWNIIWVKCWQLNNLCPPPHLLAHSTSPILVVQEALGFQDLERAPSARWEEEREVLSQRSTQSQWKRRKKKRVCDSVLRRNRWEWEENQKSCLVTVYLETSLHLFSSLSAPSLSFPHTQHTHFVCMILSLSTIIIYIVNCLSISPTAPPWLLIYYYSVTERDCKEESRRRTIIHIQIIFKYKRDQIHSSSSPHLSFLASKRYISNKSQVIFYSISPAFDV